MCLAVSAAEKDKRAFPVAELVAFAHVLGVTISYLLLPPPNVYEVELVPGVAAEANVIMGTTLPFRGTDSSEVRYLDAAGRFFQHLVDLSELTAAVRGDIQEMGRTLQDLRAARAAEQVPG